MGHQEVREMWGDTLDMAQGSEASSLEVKWALDSTLLSCPPAPFGLGDPGAGRQDAGEVLQMSKTQAAITR